ncbi:glycosyltransferase family 4 protein [Geothrix sp. PMB-07]|uniref:glycosyltransferase family 4 protein n=1 Tax=Geothrix sp. PMB-07 TaxID=3068640 RepID=UPI00274262CA|nr:glycosyltransferase family 4 protein [Geothrix sp. PMB-07]WLT31314.1 glycosyltransferase family 4 protein [Geothrix sp. PMB-07]
MHILFLTDNFPPEVNAPASRTYEHTREWIKAGHQVTVLTCAPNFPKGKVFAGYRNRLWQTEWMDGIRVIRVWTYIAANEGFLARILDYVSFMISSTLAAMLVRQADLVIGTSPQFFTACAAYLVGRLKGIPFIFELRDLWPESIKAVGAMKDSWIIRCLEHIELFLYQRADAVISVTNSFKQNLIGRGIDGHKIHVVTNGVDLSRFAPLPKDAALAEELGLKDCFVGGYIGTHGMAHGLETLLDSAEIFQKENRMDIHILLLGDGACKADLKAKAKERGLTSVIFIDSVPKAEVVRYWSLLDISIIHLRDTDLFSSVIPSKMFESMGMGIPLVHGVSGESAEIVEREGVGLVFHSGDAQALHDALVILKNDSERFKMLRNRCLEAAVNYDRAALAAKMLRVIEAIRGVPK